MIPAEELKCFHKSMQFLFKAEGGTNFDPLDRGGLTNYGISKKQYPDVDVKNLNQSEAMAIYRLDYWNTLNCGNIDPYLARVLFDTGVNCGTNSAIMWLQRSCNLFGEELTVDGILGSKTKAAVNRCDAPKLLQLILANRLRRYTTLIEKHPRQKKFIRGWIVRVSNLIEDLYQ